VLSNRGMANKQYTRQWGDFSETEYYSYSWFEALANALNEEMRNETTPEKFTELLQIVSVAYETLEEEYARLLMWRL
jgi:hypothetical protein